MNLIDEHCEHGEVVGQRQLLLYHCVNLGRRRRLAGDTSNHAFLNCSVVIVVVIAAVVVAPGPPRRPS